MLLRREKSKARGVYGEVKKDGSGGAKSLAVPYFSKLLVEIVIEVKST